MSEPQTYPYMTLHETIRANGDRHMANAERHAAVGRKEYAYGSFKKARRNYDRAARIERPFGFFALPIFTMGALHG